MPSKYQNGEKGLPWLPTPASADEKELWYFFSQFKWAFEATVAPYGGVQATRLMPQQDLQVDIALHGECSPGKIAGYPAYSFFRPILGGWVAIWTIRPCAPQSGS